MRRLFLLLIALALTACQVAAPPVAKPSAPMESEARRELFQGSVVAAGGYQAQAIASDLAGGATVSLIDLGTGQVKGTGISDPAGTFTVTALSTFTPTLNTLYVLEAAKATGAAGKGSFSLRTIVSLSPTGWTSISGSTVTISTATTAVALLYRHKALSAADILGKVTYDPTRRLSAMSALNSTYPESAVRQVEAQVQRALSLNLDPMQTVKPALDGSFSVSLATGSVNLLNNGGFEAGGATLDFWSSGGNDSPYVVGIPDTATGVGQGRSCKITTTQSGDTWFGQGASALPPKRCEIPLQEGQTYTFSVYAKGAVGGEKLRLCVSGGLAGFLELGSTDFILTTAFQRYSFTFVAPRSTPIATLFFRTGGQTTYPATLWIDSAQVEPGATASSYSDRPRGLLYDSTTSPASGVGHTYGPGHGGGTGLVVDMGLNKIANGHGQNGLTGYSTPNGGSLALSTAYGTPPYCPISSAFVMTHDAGVGWANAGCAVSVLPYTVYTMSAWLYFPSSANAASLTNNLLVTTAANGNSGSLGSNLATITRDRWYRQSLTFYSGPNTTIYAWPIDTNGPNSVGAFTMLQVEEGTTLHPYTGGSGVDRFAIDPRYVPRNSGTIEYWFSPLYDSSDTRIHPSLMGISDRFDYTIMYLTKSGNSLTFGIDDGPIWHTATWTPSTPLWIAGSWHHIAMTWGAPATTTLYFDGQPVASNPYAGGLFTLNGYDATGLGNLYLSGVTGNVTYSHNATIDQLRIYDYARSPQEIARSYLGIQAPADLGSAL